MYEPEADYTKQSVYALLYSMYRSVGTVSSEHGVPYEFTFNTWGYAWPEGWGEAPTHAGLWFMDSSSAAAEMVTLCAAAGYVVHFFPTGQGNVIGNPVLPVIKICANPRTVRTMSEHVDVDTSGLLQREITLEQAGDKLIDMMFRTANGRLTAAEALGHREFVLTRLYESA
jgi:(2R)-sulfolactate sulfo-lyase subunit beta